MTTLDWVSTAIVRHGYEALFLAAIAEGPVVTVIGAFLAAQGLLKLAWVYLVAVGADLVGDLLFYALGRSGRLSGQRWQHRLSARQQRQLRWLQDGFHAHAGKTLLFGKLTHAVGFLVLIAAGSVRIPVRLFLGYNLLGTLPKTGLFVLIGYFVGAAYNRVDTYLWVLSCLGFVLICVGFGIYLRRRLARRSDECV